MTNLPFDTVSVDGFRGLHNLRLEELGSINILVGGNNSGKSSVLEAISLLASPDEASEWGRVVERRDYGGLDESRVLSLRWCFNRDMFADLDDAANINLECEFGVEGAYPLRSMTSSYTEHSAPLQQVASKDYLELFLKYSPNIFGREFSKPDSPVRVAEIKNKLAWADGYKNVLSPKSFRVSQLGSSVTIDSDKNVVRKSKLGLSRAILLPYSYQLNDLQVASRTKQLKLDNDELFIDLIREFDPDILSVEVGSFQSFRPAIYIKHKKLGVAPLSIFGDAMRRCLLIATTITQLGQGGVLLLDEVEVGIHTSCLPKVFKWLANVAKRMEIQVFASTHSLEVLDALLDAKVSENEIVTYNLKQGVSRTKNIRYSGVDLHRIRYERGLDIR